MPDGHETLSIDPDDCALSCSGWSLSSPRLCSWSDAQYVNDEVGDARRRHQCCPIAMIGISARPAHVVLRSAHTLCRSSKREGLCHLLALAPVAVTHHFGRS
jgi:hypothetical protein